MAAKTPTRSRSSSRKPAPDTSPYALTPQRHGQLIEEAAKLPDDALLLFPGRLDQRVVWASKIRLAAERDAAELVKTPFHGEPGLTHEEILAQRDQIELLRTAESRFQAARKGQESAIASFEKAAAEATEHKETLLRAFDLRFRNNPEGQKRLSEIRAGQGDADLVQDVSDLVLLASEEKAYLAKCPRGEAAAAERMRALSPQLAQLLAAKGMTEEAQQARRLRDAAYTLVMRTERRLRAAADYWYRGTDKAKDYAAFSTPTARSADESTPPPADDDAAAAQPAAAP